MLIRFHRSMIRVLSALALASLVVMVGPATAEVEPGMQMGIDHPGNDLSVFALATPDPGLCRQTCDQNEQCATWTFVKPGVMQANAVCALKFMIATEQGNQNVISGIKGQTGYATGGGARIENVMGLGMDLPGGDLGVGGTLERGDPALCAQRCEANGQCQSWTFARPGGPNQPAVCWLKGSVPNPVLNASTISARRSTPLPVRPTTVPAVSGGTPPAGSGFGVWAYVIGANAGNFGDPCQIQYVAVAIPGNRYDANPNYRRVRARFSMEDASNDITFFSVFMQDQPDGVVKFRSCSPATTLLPPRPGGPGELPGPVFGVWAYTIGTATFADPCAIQYVRSQIAGNRFDGNSRYVLVRTELSGSEASQVVTMFSAFMQDLPDGVVKMVPCDGGRNAGKNGNGTGVNGATPSQEVAAWMTGTFDSTFGLMQFSPGGGTYTNPEGSSLQVTGINGAVVEGIWQQPVASGSACTDGVSRGRFRFTFNSSGFSGLWSYCDKEPSYSWSGTRRSAQ